MSNNPSITRRHARTIAARDGWRCHYCGIPLDPDIRTTHSFKRIGGRSIATMPTWPVVDHKVPRCDGGTDLIDNLLLACSNCNNMKGRKSYERYMAEIDDWMRRNNWAEFLAQYFADEG